MKRFFTRLSLVAFTLTAVVALSSCSKDDINDGGDDGNNGGESYELRVLTFEDTDYAGSGNYLGNSDWSTLIDDAEYAGTLLYNNDGWYGNSDYYWYDENNTELYSKLVDAYGTTNFGSGGIAISNYINTDLASASYTEQLSVPCSTGGNNNSNNFAVFYNGYASYPSLSFNDNEARVVESMYVIATTYLANNITNADGWSSFESDDTLDIYAVGYNGNIQTNTISFRIASSSSEYTDTWTKWELADLGAVTRIEFYMEGTDIGEWGLNTPAYFAFDDVAVRFDI